MEEEQKKRFLGKLRCRLFNSHNPYCWPPINGPFRIGTKSVCLDCGKKLIYCKGEEKNPTWEKIK
jgi:hypothetical protein